MVELVDSVDLGSTARACRFESCCPHQKKRGLRELFIKQGLRNKNYGSCHARVADKKGMHFDVHTLFSFVGALLVSSRVWTN